MITDLRSDTFTRPTPEMLKTMVSAPVGDDVFHEDPSVNKLEQVAAEMFGMEAAIFCPSGTMTNQIGIKCHTHHGDEVICEATSHVFVYEGGGIAFNSGCQVRPLTGTRGQLSADQVRSVINPDDVHRPHTSLVVVENTANRGGGSCYEFADLQEIKEVCLEYNLKFHLDGARLFNAMTAKEGTPAQYGELFDSISICLSKGLGAPVGSVLIGSAEMIKKARRIRKVLGGGMRQAGYMAAAGIFALENNVLRLEEDHIHAKMLANALLKKDFTGKMLPVETNIVIFEVTDSYTPANFSEFMKKHNILCIPISATQVRMVTHLDVSREQINEVINLLEVM